LEAVELVGSSASIGQNGLDGVCRGCGALGVGIVLRLCMHAR